MQSMNPSVLTHPTPRGINPGEILDDEANYKKQKIGEAVKASAHVSLDEAIARLESDLRSGHDVDNLEQESGIMALSALKRAREEYRMNKLKRFGFWVVFILFSCIAFFIAKGYVNENTVIGTHVTTKECSIPFGKDQLQLIRHLNYPSKTLFGYQLLDKSNPSVEDEVKLPGDTITILGADNRRTEKNPKGKWWRENYAKGEFGTRKLKYADQLWFIGEKEKTALVNRDAFCN